ncbi:HTH-type transcriptional regulator YodB [Methanobrevibacter woesei]|jgi:DNA-binding HxlR family transcriptional regulator|uniref:HTH-type transcriptional regulator YodB n=1 Tax=Methanobrevibacter woesei TaxID=190976 RepID=A0A2U1S5G5_9EURY|nr:helix-turn-helix domain-containing protein [Methanobrevibacter woesei]PWB84816.1 HTH-type transcriptional regulator YodB [Methanobrevibacter woesei]
MDPTITCPIQNAVQLFNKKWSILIIRDMFFGKKQFSEFKEGKDISNKVLSSCLKDLEEKKIIEKRVMDTTPVTTEYHLTEAGKHLNKVLYELASFILDSNLFEEYKSPEVKESIKNQFKEALDIS